MRSSLVFLVCLTLVSSAWASGGKLACVAVNLEKGTVQKLAGEASIPAPSAPTGPASDRADKDVVSLSVAQNGLVTATAREFRVVDATSGQPRCVLPLKFGQPIEGFVIDAHLVVYRSSLTTYGIDPSTCKARWTHATADPSFAVILNNRIYDAIWPDADHTSLREFDVRSGQLLRSIPLAAIPQYDRFGVKFTPAGKTLYVEVWSVFHD